MNIETSICLAVIHLLLLYPPDSNAKNPIIPDRGVNDPHIRIFDGMAWLSANHDKSIGKEKFIMEDWWLWSSEDLVNWKLEYILKPEDTYTGKPFQGCWATDIVKRNGKYYWYFSERNEQAGVMVAEWLQTGAPRLLLRMVQPVVFCLLRHQPDRQPVFQGCLHQLRALQG